MTSTYLGQWLHDANHYRMQLKGDAADNPDQRITDDVKLFVDQTLDISVGLLSSIVTLASFVVILWGLSAAAPLTIFGREFDIPGYLVWGALIYAVLGTALTQWIGSPLVDLNFQQQRYEADFRFNLVRVRENSEQIALLQGESAERQRLSERFGRVVDNWYAIMRRTKRLTAFTASYAQAAVVFPYILVAPAYFADKIQLGGMMQTASAFSSVQTGAVVLRVDLPDAGGMARRHRAARRIRDGDRERRHAGDQAGLDRYRGLDRQRQYRPGAASGPAARTERRWSRPTASAIRGNERTLVTGPSGAGKSTLFRAIAGVWPFGSGSIAVPAHATLMMLPQRPYFPVGSLKAAIVYPAEAGAFDSDRVRDALDRGGPAAARLAARRGRALEPHALARRAAAPWAGTRAAAPAAISVPR